jgi:threonine/homoserine/homoserine lactone efflux protein
MPSLDTLGVFALAVLAFAAIPGPAVFYIVTRSVSQGRRAGYVSAAGIAAGGLFHVAAATLGISALLASSATAFTVVKYFGAAYLVYLGVRSLRREDDGDPVNPVLALPPRRVFRDGVVVAVLNPKTALFFLAFLPQFVEPGRGPVPMQLAVLGLVLVVIALASDISYALVSGSARNWLRNRRELLRRSRFLTGGVYITLGVTAALTGERPSSA